MCHFYPCWWSPSHWPRCQYYALTRYKLTVLCSIIYALNTPINQHQMETFSALPETWKIREFTGHQWIPLTKASDAELWCFLWSPREQTVELITGTPSIWDAIAFITDAVTVMDHITYVDPCLSSRGVSNTCVISVRCKYISICPSTHTHKRQKNTRGPFPQTNNG